MTDLSRIQDDLGFIRRTVDAATPHSPVSIYFLWAAICLAGFVLMDLQARHVGWYWMIAGPVGGLISVFLGWRGARKSGAMDRAEGLRHAQHWASMMVAIFLVVLLAGRGVIAWRALGPIILVILALTYFQAGIHLDPPLRWVGLLMVGGFFLVLSTAPYAWTIVGAAISLTLVLVGILESRRHAVEA